MADNAVWAFGRVLRANWFAAMSGGFSVPFSALAVFSDQTYQQLVWAALALAAFGFAAFRIWKTEYDRTIVLQSKLDALEAAPKLRCSFSMGDPGCVRPNTAFNLSFQDGPHPTDIRRIQIPCDWYRVRVESGSTQRAVGCRGRLIWIKKDGTTVLEGEIVTLPFALAENPDAINKTIFPGAPEFLDVLGITENSVILALHKFVGASSINWDDIFSLPGEYVLRIVVVSDNAVPVSIDLLFQWTLKRATSRISWQTAD